MTNILVRIFIKDCDNASDPDVRSRYGILAGIVGIICNILLFAAKLIIGTLSGSVSITADAVNNLSDASSSIMTLMGFYISRKPPDQEHPYGYARFEYLSGLGVAALIMIIGYQLARSSIEKILHPSPVGFSGVLVAVLLLSIAVKLWMALFNKSIGLRISSTSLIATAADSRNDVISTGAVLAGAVISYITGLEIDGYIGFLVALFILYSGFGIARQTIKPLLGAPADPELVKLISDEITCFDERILDIHDLMVHDYGPGQCFASVHVEVDAKNNVVEIHEVIDDIEHMFYEKYNIHMVIHYDPVVTDDAELNKIKSMITQELTLIDMRIGLHDFRMVRGSKHTNLIFDIVLPDDLKGREKEIQDKLDDLWAPQIEMKYYMVITFDSPSFNTL